MGRISAVILVFLATSVILIPTVRADTGRSEATTLVVGPVRDTNGIPLEGVHVDIYAGSGHYNGTTDMGGFSMIVVTGPVRNTTVTITLKASGYADAAYTTAVNSTGLLDQDPPEMVRTDTGEVSSYLWLWQVLFVLVIILVFGVVMFSRTRVEEDSSEEDSDDQNE